MAPMTGHFWQTLAFPRFPFLLVYLITAIPVRRGLTYYRETLELMEDPE